MVKIIGINSNIVFIMSCNKGDEKPLDDFFLGEYFLSRCKIVNDRYSLTETEPLRSDQLKALKEITASLKEVCSDNDIPVIFNTAGLSEPTRRKVGLINR